MDGRKRSQERKSLGATSSHTGQENPKIQSVPSSHPGQEDHENPGAPSVPSSHPGTNDRKVKKSPSAPSSHTGQEDHENTEAQSVPSSHPGQEGPENPEAQSVSSSHSGQTVEEDLKKLDETSDVTGVDCREWRILLIGTTGVGKSATGNTILGMEPFESKMSAESVTQKSQIGRAERFGKKIVLVDTPGIFDTRMDKDKVIDEIQKCIGITSPGLHAVIFVMRPDRFKEEEKQTLEIILQHFGEDLIHFVVIVFTRKEDIDKGSSIDDYVKSLKQDSILSDTIQKCKSRYVAFGNKEQQEQKDLQVQELFSIIEKLIEGNGDRYFTNDRYMVAENNMKREMVKERKRLDEEETRKIDYITARYEEKIKQNEKEMMSAAQVREEAMRRDHAAILQENENKRIKEQEQIMQWREKKEKEIEQLQNEYSKLKESSTIREHLRDEIAENFADSMIIGGITGGIVGALGTLGTLGALAVLVLDDG